MQSPVRLANFTYRDFGPYCMLKIELSKGDVNDLHYYLTTTDPQRWFSHTHTALYQHLPRALRCSSA